MGASLSSPVCSLPFCFFPSPFHAPSLPQSGPSNARRRPGDCYKILQQGMGKSQPKRHFCFQPKTRCSQNWQTSLLASVALHCSHSHAAVPLTCHVTSLITIKEKDKCHITKFIFIFNANIVHTIVSLTGLFSGR